MHDLRGFATAPKVAEGLSHTVSSCGVMVDGGEAHKIKCLDRGTP